MPLFSTTADVVYGVRSTAGSQALNPLSLPGSGEAERHRHVHLWQTGGFTLPKVKFKIKEIRSSFASQSG